MTGIDRAFLFEKLLDNLELYFDYKHDLNKKIKSALANKNYDYDVTYWQEFEQLENLRELSRRALDEYVATRPNDGPDEGDPGEAG